MTVQLETSDHIATITIASSNPGGLVGFDSVYSLSEVATEVRQRDDVWVVVLRSDGNDFCLGASPK